MFFQELEGDVAILVSNGVYKQCKLFTRNGYLFAQVAGGFVRLMRDGSTSNAKFRLDTLITEKSLFQDGFGRLAVEELPKARLLDESQVLRLTNKSGDA